MAFCILCSNEQNKRRPTGIVVCLGIALAGSELPTELIGRRNLQACLHLRGGQPEYRFIYRAERLKRARNPWLNPFVQKLLDED